MGKHSGPGDQAPGTDEGTAFDQMDGEQKAAEFDASHADPDAYAARNFGTGVNTATAWQSARDEQRAQADELRNRE